MAERFGLPFQPLHEDDMFDTLEDVTAAERQRGERLLWAADEALLPFECQAKLRRFLPADLPVLYAMSDEVQFLRQLQSAQEQSRGIFSDALASMLSGVDERPLATLYLNLNSPAGWSQRPIRNCSPAWRGCCMCRPCWPGATPSGAASSRP